VGNSIKILKILEELSKIAGQEKGILSKEALVQ